MVKLTPSVADNIWGGTRLITEYGIKTDKNPAAEAWVLSCHPAGPSTIQNGEVEGKTLQEAYLADKSIWFILTTIMLSVLRENTAKLRRGIFLTVSLMQS